VKGAEGLRLRRYLCPAGVWTIGWGSTRGLDGLPVTATTPDVTVEQAQWLLDRDMGGALGWVRRLVKVPLQDGQAAALLSFVQNLGPGRLQSSTLLRLLNAGRPDLVPPEFGKWVMGGGQRLPGLVLRRAAERALFTKG
jgi:lysozyme